MYPFTKLHDRRIPKVRVGVGVVPIEFQLTIRERRRAPSPQTIQTLEKPRGSNGVVRSKKKLISLMFRIKKR